VALTERLQIIVTADGKGAAREFQQIGATAERELGRTDDRIRNLSSGLISSGTQIGLAGGLATAGVFKLAQAAGNYEEAASAAGVIFGDAADDIEEFGEQAIKTAGLSARAAVEAANTFGTFGKAAGLSGDDLAKFSIDLTQLAGDLASFKNTTTDEAITAIGAALRGESEPIRRYGVLLDDATLKAEALSLGIYDGVGALTQQQKVLAAQAAIFKQTTDAQDDYNRTSDSLANQTRAFSAQIENLQKNLGEGAVPVFSELLEAANGALESFQNLSPETQNLVGRLGAIGAIGATVVGGFSVLAGGTLRLIETLGTLRGRLRDTEGNLTRTGTAAVTAGRLFGVAAGAAGAIALINALNSLTQSAQATEDALNGVRLVPDDAAFDDTLAAVDAYGETLLSAFDRISRPFNDELDLGEGVTGSFVNIKTGLENLAKAKEWDELEVAIAALGEAALLPENREFKAEIDALIAGYTGVIGRQREVDNSASDAAGGITDVGEAAEETADQTKELADRLDRARARTDLFTAILGNAKARIEAFDESIERSSGLDDFLSAGLGLNQSLSTLRSTVGQLPADIDAANVAFSDLSDDGQNALGNLIQTGDAVRESLSNALEFGGADDVRRQADRIRDELQRVFAQVGITGDKFNEYLEILGLTPEQVETAIKVSGEAEALAKIEVFQQNAELLNAPLELQVAVAEAQIAGETQKASDLIDAWYVDQQDGLIDNPFLLALGLGPTGDAERDLQAWREREQSENDINLGVNVVLPSEQELLNQLTPYLDGFGIEIAYGPVKAEVSGVGRRVAQGRATGGPVEADEVYTVNEPSLGGEMFRPSTDGFVMNAADTDRLIRGVEALVANANSGGGDTINIYETAGPRQTAEELIRSKSANRFLAGVA
jgi:hypothetical protein